MDEKKFDVLLNMDDENFIDDLTKAMGLKKGDAVKFTTPQFTRTDGKVITYLPTAEEEYEGIKKLSPENLKKIGCQKWDEKNGEILWLYPSEWYAFLPDNYEVVDINWEKELFKPGVTDNDIRFGALSYGFIQKANNTLSPQTGSQENDASQDFEEYTVWRGPL